jgi:hypothetical protein
MNGPFMAKSAMKGPFITSRAAAQTPEVVRIHERLEATLA